MLVTNRVSGPTYSTDLTAHDLSSFTSRRVELPERTESPRSTSPSPSLEDLYPAWFAAESAPTERERPRAMHGIPLFAKFAVAIALATGAVGSGIVALTR